MQRSTSRLIGTSLVAFAALGLAPLHAQQSKLEEAIMAVPDPAAQRCKTDLTWSEIRISEKIMLT